MICRIIRGRRLRRVRRSSSMSDLWPDSVELIDPDDAEAVLGKHIPNLRRCLEIGFQAWTNLKTADPDLHRPLGKRTRASFIYDHAVHYAETIFTDAQDV